MTHQIAYAEAVTPLSHVAVHILPLCQVPTKVDQIPARIQLLPLLDAVLHIAAVPAASHVSESRSGWSASIVV